VFSWEGEEEGVYIGFGGWGFKGVWGGG